VRCEPHNQQQDKADVGAYCMHRRHSGSMTPTLLQNARTCSSVERPSIALISRQVLEGATPRACFPPQVLAASSKASARLLSRELKVDRSLSALDFAESPSHLWDWHRSRYGSYASGYIRQSLYSLRVRLYLS